MILKLTVKLMITLGVVFYLLIIPYLELNTSHVFNTTWPEHARFHEVWQLTTNCLLGLIVLWLTWKKESFALAALINCIIMGGVLVAHFSGPFYGGSIQSGNISKLVLGLDMAAFAALFVILISAAAVILDKTQKATA